MSRASNAARSIVRVLLASVPIVASACHRSKPPVPLDEEAAAPANAPSPESLPPPEVEAAARCTAVHEPIMLGDDGPSRASDAGAAPSGDAPFASEVGDAVVWSEGYALGALSQGAHSAEMLVVLVGSKGESSKIVRLGDAHGDVDPPRLAARGNVLVAGVLEPAPNGRLLRLAKIENGTVTWGASFTERRDESEAYDLALGDKRGLVVWDEEVGPGSVIQASTFDVATASAATIARPVSPRGTDAESPRLIAKPGGYWLLYIARRPESDEPDGSYETENTEYRWIEVVPLDANGAATGTARAVTPRDGHVTVFDAADGPDGSALIVWREDDAPSGSSGGRIMRALVRPGAIAAPEVLLDEPSTAGVPNLVHGWLAIADINGATKLAPMTPTGELAGALAAEPLVGSGEPLGSNGETLLVARPTGKAVKLVVVSCANPGSSDAGARSAHD
jgi:hypothetical protein